MSNLVAGLAIALPTSLPAAFLTFNTLVNLGQYLIYFGPCLASQYYDSPSTEAICSYADKVGADGGLSALLLFGYIASLGILGNLIRPSSYRDS